MEDFSDDEELYSAVDQWEKDHNASTIVIMDERSRDSENATPKEGEDEDDEVVSPSRKKKKSRRRIDSGSEYEEEDPVPSSSGPLTQSTSGSDEDDDSQSTVDNDSDSEEEEQTSSNCSRNDSNSDQSDSDGSDSIDESSENDESVPRSRRPRKGGVVDLVGRIDDGKDHYLESLKNNSKSQKTKKSKAGKKKKIQRNSSKKGKGKSTASTSAANDDGYYGEAQEVSIHKILLHKFEKDKTEEDIIEQIISEYKSETNVTYIRSNQYEEEKTEDGESVFDQVIREEDKIFFEGDDFQIKIYSQEVLRTIGLLQSFGITKKSVVIHSIVFYYRPKEIFALTTGQAWNVVQWCSDFDFPAQIAARILSEKGEIEKTSKGLVGNEATSKKTMKKHQETSAFDLLELCTSFTAELRANASIQRLAAFSGQSQQRTKIIKALGSLRIKKRLDICDFPSILSHFSVISKGLRTYVANRDPDEDSEEETDTDVHLKYLTPVSHEMKRTLDKEVASLFLRATRGSRQTRQENLRRLDNFNLSHKHYSDFSNAVAFDLHYKQQIIEHYDHTPTLEEIIEHIPIGAMKDSIEGRRGRTRQGTATEEELAQELLDKVKLSFKTHGLQRKPERFFNFIEGPFWYERDQRVYWHVMSIWSAVQNGYLLLVHQLFLELLKKSLMKEQHVAFLPIPWTPAEEIHPEDAVRSYIAGYRRRDGFFIWESNNKLFDILFVSVDEETEEIEVYLYYLTSTLNYKPLATGSRITSSTTSIQKVCFKESANGESSSSASTDLQNFYTQNIRLEEYFRTFQAFKEALCKAKIVYAVGQEYPKLSNESQLETKMTWDDISEILATEGKDVDLAAPLLDALIRAQYLESTESITSKLLISTPRNFELNSNVLGNQQETNRFVYEKIVEKYKSYYKSFILKLDFWRIKKDLNTANEFWICEIKKRDAARVSKSKSPRKKKQVESSPVKKRKTSG